MQQINTFSIRTRGGALSVVAYDRENPREYVVLERNYATEAIAHIDPFADQHDGGETEVRPVEGVRAIADDTFMDMGEWRPFDIAVLEYLIREDTAGDTSMCMVSANPNAGLHELHDFVWSWSSVIEHLVDEGVVHYVGGDRVIGRILESSVSPNTEVRLRRDREEIAREVGAMCAARPYLTNESIVGLVTDYYYLRPYLCVLFEVDGLASEGVDCVTDALKTCGVNDESVVEEVVATLCASIDCADFWDYWFTTVGDVSQQTLQCLRDLLILLRGDAEMYLT